MIKYIVDQFSSLTDRNGNRYHAATITRVADGERIHGIIDGPRNAAGALRGLGLDWSEIHSSESSMPIREFQRTVKGWPYLEAGNTIADFVAGGPGNG